jgi:hypothetical protein
MPIPALNKKRARIPNFEPGKDYPRSNRTKWLIRINSGLEAYEDLIVKALEKILPKKWARWEFSSCDGDPDIILLGPSAGTETTHNILRISKGISEFGINPERVGVIYDESSRLAAFELARACQVQLLCIEAGFNEALIMFLTKALNSRR